MQVQNPLECDKIKRECYQGGNHGKTNRRRLGAWFLGNCPFTSLKWQWITRYVFGGNLPEQINEINTYHTNKHYFKDVVLDDKINAYTDLAEALKDVDAILFVVPTKVTRLVAQQVAQTLDHKAVIMHASKGLEPDSHKRLSTILEEEIPEHLRSDIVVVSGPSHAEETIVRDLTLITAASKDLQTAQYVQELFSNHYFRLYTNTDVIGVKPLVLLKTLSLSVLEPYMV